MATAKKKATTWTSDRIDVLHQEVVEMSERYLLHLEKLRKQKLGSDAYIEHWAEIDVALFWLKMKIEATQEEMERISNAWPDE